MNLSKHIDMLGRRATDRVTGFQGVISSVSFDLYGCIQAIVTPPIDKDGKKGELGWFDVSRLLISDGERVMEVPNYDVGPAAEGRHGPEEKPTPSC